MAPGQPSLASDGPRGSHTVGASLTKHIHNVLLDTNMPVFIEIANCLRELASQRVHFNLWDTVFFNAVIC